MVSWAKPNSQSQSEAVNVVSTEITRINSSLRLGSGSNTVASKSIKTSPKLTLLARPIKSAFQKKNINIVITKSRANLVSRFNRTDGRNGYLLLFGTIGFVLYALVG